MKHLLKPTSASLLALSLMASHVEAQSIISQWNFNSVPPDSSTSTGTISPSTGSGTISLIGGTTSTFASGSPGDPASADNSALNLTGWATQATGNGTAGLQVNTSTVGFSSISISLDFRQSGTVSRDFQLQVSSDGTTFNNVSGGTATVGTIGSGNTGTTFSSAGFYSNNPGGGSQNFVQSLTYNLALGGAYENDANFAFRWVAVFDPGTGAGANYIGANAGTTAAYSTAGTGRFDDLTITGSPVPEPSTLALGGIGLAALAGMIRRQRKN